MSFLLETLGRKDVLRLLFARVFHNLYHRAFEASHIIIYQDGKHRYFLTREKHGQRRANGEGKLDRRWFKKGLAFLKKHILPTQGSSTPEILPPDPCSLCMTASEIVSWHLSGDEISWEHTGGSWGKVRDEIMTEVPLALLFLTITLMGMKEWTLGRRLESYVSWNQCLGRFQASFTLLSKLCHNSSNFPQKAIEGRASGSPRTQAQHSAVYCLCDLRKLLNLSSCLVCETGQ